MKKKWRGFFIVLLAGIILGTANPARLYAGGQTGEGNLWDPFVNTNPFIGGTRLPGTLTIIYNPSWLYNFSTTACNNGMPQAPMFICVRFIYSNLIYTYEGSTSVCLGDIGTLGSGGQGDVIMAFLDYVIKDIFQNQGVKMELKKYSQSGNFRS